MRAILRDVPEPAEPGLDNDSLTPVTTLRVPASSANLGPGFDSLGIALQVYLTCRYTRAPQFSIRCSGRDADLISCDEDNLIWQTALTVASRVRMPLPAVDLEIANEIPLGKGLGSSAAAITAGVIIGVRLLNLEWKTARILDEAARLEGHPDNVAACVLGSVVASAVEPGGITRAIRLEMPPNSSKSPSLFRTSPSPPKKPAPSFPNPIPAQTPPSTSSGRRC